MTGKKLRDEILDTAKSLISGDRAEAYDTKDDATGNFKRIATLWSPILGIDVTPEQVALCMIQLKVARAITSKGHKDSYVDLAGYAALGYEVAEQSKIEEQQDLDKIVGPPIGIKGWTIPE